MRTITTGSSCCACLLIGCLAAALLGCGTSEYNRLASKRLGDLRGEIKFRTLFAPTQLGDTPVRIRLPMIFKDSYTEDSRHKVDGGKIKSDRVQPPFLQIPGFKICYEGVVNETPVLKLPYYCYLGVVPARPGDTEALAKELQAKLKETFKDTPDEWETVDAESPTDKAVQWKKLRVEGEQLFYYNQNVKDVSGKLPATFEIWLCDKQDYTIIMAWRVPNSIQGPPPVPLPTNVAELMMSKPSDIRIDLVSLPALMAGTVTVDAPVATTDKG